MATFTVTADIELGDDVTTSTNLFFKIYNNGILYHTTGTSVDDADVTLVGDIVTIVNVPVIGSPTYVFTITQIDEANNESDPSNQETLSLPVGSWLVYEEGVFELGMYE